MITNRDIFIPLLNDLINEPVYTCLKIYSKGNQIFLLKDTNGYLFILTIPNAPLAQSKSDALVNFGFKEIWEKINYIRSIKYSETNAIDKLFDEFELIFESVFRVKTGRIWRHELITGMRTLKDIRTPLITAAQRREKKKKRKPFIRILNDFAMSAGLILLVIVGFYDKNLSDELTQNVVLSIIGISIILVQIGRFLSSRNYNVSSIDKKRFMGIGFSDYFQQNGFVKLGDRYKGQINGYRTELIYTDLRQNIIIIYHKKISWESVLKMSTGKFFNSTKYDWTGMFFSQKIITGRLTKEKILIKANEFVDYIIELELERTP